MSLFDSAKSKINSVVNATFTSTNVTYGFIGISTAILSYYTFFEKDIEVPLTEEPTKQNVVELPVPEPVAENAQSQNAQPQNAQPQNGGKKHKKTRKHK
jgi:hypothetical protein